MRSAVLETDARGTFVGSSYLYATARDWARFGQFLLQRGVWNGRSLLPVGYVDWMVGAASGLQRRIWPRPCLASASRNTMAAGTKMPICRRTRFMLRP
jgi:CubicO group peptidase (beta-lactamase class C family)